MQERTETLALNSRAPEFTLPAANRPGSFSLSKLIQSGIVVIEFLRGTW